MLHKLPRYRRLCCHHPASLLRFTTYNLYSYGFSRYLDQPCASSSLHPQTVSSEKVYSDSEHDGVVHCTHLQLLISHSTNQKERDRHRWKGTIGESRYLAVPIIQRALAQAFICYFGVYPLLLAL